MWRAHFHTAEIPLTFGTNYVPHPSFLAFRPCWVVARPHGPDLTKLAFWPIAFARRKDAELAAAAMNAAGIFSKQHIAEAGGLEKCYRMMLEALQW